MAIEVRLPTLMRKRAEGRAVVEVEGDTLGAALDDLARRYPEFAGQVVDCNGNMHRFINVFINDDDVRFLDKLDTRVKDGDTIALLPAVAGG